MSQSSKATRSLVLKVATLDLHTDTGLAALKQAGLYDDFTKRCRYDGESFQIVDKRCVHLINAPGATKESSRGRPEIDRPTLVHMLVENLPPDVVKFSHKLRYIDDNLTLHFDGTTESGFDLVVGADGAWSKSRSYLSDVQPYYTGISGYECTIPNAAEVTPNFYELVRRGSIFSFGERKSIMAQQMGNGSIKSAALFLQRQSSGPSGEAAVSNAKDLFKKLVATPSGSHSKP